MLRSSVASAFGGEPPAPFFKNTTVSRETGTARCIRSCQDTAFTICGTRSLSFCDAIGNTIRVMKASELAKLQSLPDGWVLPKSSRSAVLAVGNSVPSLLAAAIVRAASGDDPLTVAPEAGRKRGRCDDDARYEELERRVAQLEASTLPASSGIAKASATAIGT